LKLFVSTQKGISAKRQAPERDRNGNRKGQPLQAGATEAKKRGRKPGKHSSTDYTQTSIYLPIDLRNRARAKLYEKGMEMSGLIEDMLRDWLAKQR
jgi:hypothetical protein